MKTGLAQATAFLFALASAAARPTRSTSDPSTNIIKTVAGTTGPDQIAIHFNASCPGCFDDSDDGLELILKIDSTSGECEGILPSLNGHRLRLVTITNQVAEGHVTFKSRSSSGSDEKEFHASWQSLCLKGQASLLSLRLDHVSTDDQATSVPGFTASFTQQGQPNVLRLQDKPLHDIESSRACSSWLEPEDSNKLSITPLPTDHLTLDKLIAVEYEQLEELLSQSTSPYSDILSAEKTLFSLVKEEFKSCSSFLCWWRTAKTTANTICKMMAVPWKLHRSHGSGCTASGSQAACQAQDPFMMPGQYLPQEQSTPPEDPIPSKVSTTVDEYEKSHAKITSISRTVTPAPTSVLDESEIESTPTVILVPTGQEDSSSAQPNAEDSTEYDELEQPHGPPSSTHHGPPPWFKPHDGDGPSPGHHGPPPWFKPHDGDGPPPGHHGPPPWFKPHDGNGPPPGHHGPPPWFKPHDGDGPPPGHHGPPWFKPHDGNGPPPGHHGPPPWFRPGHRPPSDHHGPPSWFGHDQGEGPYLSGLSSSSMGNLDQTFDHGLGMAVISLVALVIVSIVLFKVVLFYRDPRRRAERAARIEELRTKRLYRKAACKHRFITWWNSIRSSPYRGDAEKRGILTDDSRTGNILQRHLRTLRDASNLVRNLIAAEEGRAGNQSQASGSPVDQYQRGTDLASEYAPNVASSSDSRLLSEPLPVYIAPPPRYEQEIDGEITVVEGFEYTPSNSGYTPSTLDDATESSIVDCTPRLSFETGRSTIFSKDGNDATPEK